MNVRINFFSGTSTRVSYETYSTVAEVKAALMMKIEMEMSKVSYYGIYEVFDRSDCTEERFLNENDRFADVVNENCMEVRKAAKVAEEANYLFFLKIKLYFPFNYDDIDTVTMLYVQAAYDVLKDKYPFDETAYFQLAALKLVADHGCKSEKGLRFLTNNIYRYLPNSLVKKNTDAFNVSKVTKIYDDYQGLGQLSAKVNYLAEIEKSHVFQSHFFYVQFKSEYNKTNPDKIPLNCILLVKRQSVVICDIKSNELVEIKYEDVITWGVSTALLVLCLPYGDEQYKKYYLSTEHVEEIYFLLDCYTNLMAGNDLVETVSRAGEKLNRVKTTEVSIRGKEWKMKRIGTKFSK